MYIVKYSSGSYDSWGEEDIFVTSKKSTATKYCTKFNTSLKKWKEYYKKFERVENGMSWIKDEHAEQHFHRWHIITEVNHCLWQEIEIRN